MAGDPRLPLLSATGSTKMGRDLAQKVQRRLGRSLLELGGNNAVIVAPSANLELASRAILFGAVGTAGQRCTTTRRLFVHQSIEKELTERLIAAYRRIPVGNPLEPGTLQGPLISLAAVENMARALRRAWREGGRILCGGEPLRGRKFPGGRYVSPCLVKIRPGAKIVREETFAPILYLTAYTRLEDAIAWNNAVPQGLSSAIFTNDLREAELFLSQRGSDCGLANVNLGTSGAEIGGAFGGEKETGGGQGKRQRRLEKLHAPPNRDHQLLLRSAFGPGHPLRRIGGAIGRPNPGLASQPCWEAPSGLKYLYPTFRTSGV